jgi:hypothetical protein
VDGIKPDIIEVSPAEVEEYISKAGDRELGRQRYRKYHDEMVKSLAYPKSSCIVVSHNSTCKDIIV